MRSGRIFSQITKLYVECDKHALLSVRGRGYNRIGLRESFLVLCRGDVVVEAAQHRLKSPREVFVELQSHDPTAIFQMFSRESSAA